MPYVLHIFQQESFEVSSIQDLTCNLTWWIYFFTAPFWPLPWLTPLLGWVSLSSVTLKTVVPLYLLGAATEICSWTGLHYVWVKVFQLPYPIPFVLHVNLIFFVFPATIVAIWFKFPRSWRKNSDFRHRLMYLLQAHFYVAFFMTLKYAIFTVAFVYIPSEFQWILVLLLILARELGQILLNKICFKMIEKSDGREDWIEIVNAHLG